MLTFSPSFGNSSFFHAGRDECPFVNLFMSESFCQNVTVCRETAVEQYQAYFLDRCNHTCERKYAVNDVNREKVVDYVPLCRSRKDTR